MVFYVGGFNSIAYKQFKLNFPKQYLPGNNTYIAAFSHRYLKEILLTLSNVL